MLPKCFCCTCPEWGFWNILQLNPPNIAPETMNMQILILPANSNGHRFLPIHYRPLEQDDRVCRFFSKFDPLNLIWQNCQEVMSLLASIGDQFLFALHNTNLKKKISHLKFKMYASRVNSNFLGWLRATYYSSKLATTTAAFPIIYY